jgi:transcriptional regulator with GAF, ATPase, and Fis domain/tetratricopeptide (TPR) repeat protein
VNGRWRLERLLGEGADATAWAAVDARDGRRVALKALRRLAEPAARERFRWEFAALAEIDHPNLLPVFDLGQAEPGGPLVAGQLFFTSELVEGGAASLAALPPAKRARALSQLVAETASALDALHRRGLVHHDVKPGNLLVDERGSARLADLGLSTARGIAGGLRGSPGYLPPEAFGGSSEPAVDLYGLGATAFELWYGRPLRSGGDLAAHLRAALQPPPALDEMPTELALLVRRLLDPDPAERPSSARAVVDEALRLGARLDGELLPSTALHLARPRLVGRAADLERALNVLADPATRVLVVEGAPGSGRSRFVEELRRLLQLRAAAAGLLAPPWLDRPRTDERIGKQLARLAEREQLLRVDLGERPDPADEELLALAANGAALPSRLVVEAPTGLTLAGDGVARIALAALSAKESAKLVASMLGAEHASLARAVHAASGGEPRRAVALVRSAAAQARGAIPSAADVAAVAGEAIEALLAAVVRRLSPESRRAVEALSVLGRPATIAELAALIEEGAAAVLTALRAAALDGVVELDGDRVRFPARGHAQAAYAAAAPARRKELHRRALAAVDEKAATAVEDRARHLAVLGPAEAAAEAALAAGELRLHDRLQEAEAWLEAAVRDGAGEIAGRARLKWAEARTRRADYAGALETLAPLFDDSSRRVRAAAQVQAARAEQRAGDRAAAEKRLGALLHDPQIPPRERAEARGLYGRVLIARGAFAEAARATETDGGDETGALAEARGLALLYLGRVDEADRAFATVEEMARAAADAVELARARSFRGMAAQARDDLAAAAAAYQQALDGARAAGDLHGAAIYALNLGTSLRDLAEYERALAPMSEAARDLGRLGKRLEQSIALFNWGNLLLSIGDTAGAEQAAREALAIGEAERAGREAALARLVLGDLERRAGRPEAAAQHYRAALAPSANGSFERVLAARALAETLAAAGEARAARRALGEAVAGAPAANLVDRVALAALAVALDLDERGELPERLERVVQVAERAARSGRRDLAFRAELACARGALRLGLANKVTDSLARAQFQWEEIRMRIPELRRDSAEEDPEVRKLRALAGVPLPSTPGASATPSPSRPTESAAARRLLAINKRINSELRLDRLLELILDTVIELTSAERGFILLGSENGTLRVECARNMDQESLAPAGGDAAFSRSIAERAAREGTPIVTLDAAGDRRFEAALSVSDLKLRSVLAVPLSVRGALSGCVYADNRLRAGAFGDEDVALVCDLAEQAGIALANARLLDENERQRKAVAELNRELERKVADQAIELGELHKEVRQSRHALTVRYNYDNLVGKTPRMLELFRLLDRVTDTVLPVVIHGESGTGKELVARAIHHNGPRRDRPFVSESCAAIPETLLEAALFGHVRGAFTGADAERRGLFEVANGGTLFLDEVGEMPPAMQAKLLRVLTTGEIRRVGGERTLKVDVRLLVASNRDLERMVEEGRFREDLFYRLNVVRVALPPLRERRDDIPLLVEHFLRKQPGKPKKISRAALAKLVGYRWPGNVRELENEVQRAAALGGEVIGLEDLSPAVASGEPEAALDSDDLGLKPRVERLERSLLREALARADGNQSQAARLLGLSRFGLQKKLRRYGLEA